VSLQRTKSVDTCIPRESEKGSPRKTALLILCTIQHVYSACVTSRNKAMCRECRSLSL
jgi:hypothetical protein